MSKVSDLLPGNEQAEKPQNYLKIRVKRHSLFESGKDTLLIWKWKISIRLPNDAIETSEVRYPASHKAEPDSYCNNLSDDHSILANIRSLLWVMGDLKASSKA